MKVIGPQTVQEKDHQSTVFMIKGNNCFCPHIIVGTSGTCNTRIDCNKIVGVFRMDMSSSCIDTIQEWGYSGQFPDVNKHKCFYIIHVSLCGFEHRLLQIHDPSTKIVNKSYRSKLENKLKHCLQFFAIEKIASRKNWKRLWSILNW